MYFLLRKLACVSEIMMEEEILPVHVAGSYYKYMNGDSS